MRLKHLALGQGMGARAAEAVEAGAARGLWVLLQNCHLLPRWLPALDALLEGLERPHKARPSPVCRCAEAHLCPRRTLCCLRALMHAW